MRLYKVLGRLAAIALLTIPLHRAIGHEGHDHGTPSRATTPAAAPRAEAASALFELVAAARNGELTIYLDRFATGEPIADASIAVETPQGSVEARPAADGTYRLPAPWSSAPGRYDLIFTVTKDNDADVLPATLDVPATGQAGTVTGSTASDLRRQLAGYDRNVVVAVIGAFIAGGGRRPLAGAPPARVGSAADAGGRLRVRHRGGCA